MFRQSKTNIALCGFLMVIVGFGFQAVNADDDKETMIQLEHITQQSAQPQSNHDSRFSVGVFTLGITYYDDKLWVVEPFNQSVSAYTTDGIEDFEASFRLVPENNYARGITYGDGKFWVLEWNYNRETRQIEGDNMVYAYNPDSTYDADASMKQNQMLTALSHLGATYDADASFSLVFDD